MCRLNIFILCLSLSVSILVSCSQNKEQQIKNDIVSSDTSKTSHQTTTVSHSQGLKVYIDPVTGEFLDAPPKKIVNPNEQINKQNNIVTQDKKPVYEEQQSTKPGGGSYVKMPRP